MNTPWKLPVSIAVIIAAATVTLTGCAATPSSADLSGACAKTATVDGTLTCTALYTTGTALRLPASGDAVFGAVGRGDGTFITAAGKRLHLDAAATKQALRSNKYATTVYQAEVNGTTVTGLTPVLTIPESVIMTTVFGGKELIGTISAWRGQDAGYDENAALPVIVQMAKSTAGKDLFGTIVNADHAVRTKDGTCLPALSSSGQQNPLRAEFTKTITLERYPSMHADFDDELLTVWTPNSTGMGQGFYPSVATLMGKDPLGTTWEVTQHGDPTSGPGLNLRLANTTITDTAACA